MKSLLGHVLTDKAPIEYASKAEEQAAYGGKPEYRTEMGAYTSVSTLYSVVSFLASTTAQVGWKLYRKSPDNNPDNRKEVLIHPALSVLNKPTNFDTRQDLFEATQQHVDLTGEGWFILEKMNNGMPIGIWLARPDRMTVVKSASEFLLGYKYTNPDGTERLLAKQDVIQLRMPNPLDPYRGLAPVGSLLPTMDADAYAEFWQRNFFRNGAMPSGIVRVNQTMSDKEWKRQIQRWEEQHQGVNNANKIGFMEMGDFIQLNNTTQNDMQFLELRSFTEDKIREAYGVSKAMLGVVDDVNRANNEAQEANYAKYKLKPRLERFKQALNNEFLPMFGAETRALEFDYDNIEIEDQAKENADRDSRVASAVALISAGADPVETLKAFGLPAIPFIKKEVPTNGQV